MIGRRILPALLAIVVAAGLWWWDLRSAAVSDSSLRDDVGQLDSPDPPRGPGSEKSSAYEGSSDSASDAVVSTDVDSAKRAVTIESLLADAEQSLVEMRTSLRDYTATFVKQERDDDGVLGEESRIAMKIQTTLRNESNDAPKRVYLRFESPAGLAGREVIWGEDIYDGQMAVHETAFLLNLKTIWLNPTGFVAMQGQKYPISEIGLVRLAEKLVERGKRLLGEPKVAVSVDSDFDFDGHRCVRYAISRPKPSGAEDDFSSAEIIMDPQRSLVLRYRSYGWPAAGQTESPLLESYAYRDVRTNVGLSPRDFDVENPAYNFP